MASKKDVHSVSKANSGGWQAKESGRGVVASGDRNARSWQPSKSRGKRTRHHSASSALLPRSKEERTYPRRADLGDRRDERSLDMTERVPPEGPDGLPPADPTEEGLPEDEQGADQTSEQTASEDEDAERSLSNKLGVFGAGRSG